MRRSMLFQKKRKTWVVLFRELMLIKTCGGAKCFLEKEALNLKKRNKGLSLAGAKFLIRENLTALLRFYGEEEEKKLKRLLGLSFRK